MTKKFLFSILFAFTAFFALQAQTTTPGANDPKVRTGATAVPPGTIIVQPAPVAQVAAPAEEPGIVDYNQPDSFFDQGALGALYAAVVSILAYLGGFIPGVKNIKSGTIRSATIVFALLAAIATFRYGALTQQFFQTLIDTFLPNFAYSGVIYEGLKVILRLFKVELPKPGTAASV